MRARYRPTVGRVLLLLILFLTALGHSQEAKGQSGSQPERCSLSSLGHSAEDIQRMYEETQAVVDRHQDELKQIPGVVGGAVRLTP